MSHEVRPNGVGKVRPNKVCQGRRGMGYAEVGAFVDWLAAILVAACFGLATYALARLF